MIQIYTQNPFLCLKICVPKAMGKLAREIVCPERLPEECKQCRKRASNLEPEGILKLFSPHFYFSDMELKK